jgi:diaminohydroxyphosphoribosylaminopyrimidine deaminase/5-amino-6-(5-phosphoribosylamino)uracil reductase
VLDSSLRMPIDSRLVRDARGIATVVFTCSADDSAVAGLESAGVEVQRVAAGSDARVDVRVAMEHLAARGVRRVLAEPGGRLAGSLVSAGLVRQVMAFTAPILLGGEGAPAPVGGAGFAIEQALWLEESRFTVVGADGLLEGFLPLVA